MTFPEALGVVCSTQIVARLYPRVGPRRLMFGGLLGVATAITLLTTINLSTNAWVVRLLMFMIGVGMAYVFLPNQAASLATIPRESTGRATTLFSAQRQLGAALGVAVLSSVLAALSPTRIGATGTVIPHLAAYRAAFLAAACLSLTAALLALGVPDKDAAATMRPRAAKEAPAESVREPIAVDAD
jgi:MFS family permease